tara:strand:+ start:883 stop:1782 length:900 start_codon:yes stop_codon:yes gene_type:complete
MKRSGNHAIASWLICQMDCVKYHNHPDSPFYISIDRPSPREEYFIKVSDGHIAWKKETKLNIPYSASLKKFTDYYSIENILPSTISKFDIQELKKRKVGFELSNYDVILILRDPFNLIASRLQNQRKNKSYVLEVPELWKKYAQEFLGQTNYLSKFPKIININYNHWFSSIEYRRSISNQLGLKFTDKGLNIVSKYGSGSSFEKLDLDGKAQNMEVLYRWDTFKNDEKYLSMFQDNELLDLHEEIFGETPIARDKIFQASSNAKEYLPDVNAEKNEIYRRFSQMNYHFKEIFRTLLKGV